MGKKYGFLALIAFVIWCFSVQCTLTESAGGSGTDVGSFSLSGRLVTVEGPAQSAKVFVRSSHYVPGDSARRFSGTVKSTTSDKGGNFKFTNLAAGQYVFEAISQNGNSTIDILSLDSADSRKRIERIDSLRNLVRVKGIVNSNEGIPVAGIVEVYGTNRSARIGENGSFEILVPQGSCSMRLIPAAFELSPFDLTQINTKSEIDLDIGTINLKSGCASYACDSLIVREFMLANRLQATAIERVTKTRGTNRITDLIIEGSPLAVFPPSLVNLTALTTLELNNDSLSSVPEILSQIPNLRVLSLSKNKITSLSDAFQDLRFLSSLNLGHNPLNIIPSQIQRMQNLNSLVLTVCGIDSVSNVIFQLKNLEWINLAYNNISYAGESWAQLTNLNDIWLARNRLTAIPPGVLDLPRLKHISLDKNRLCNVSPSDSIKFFRINPAWHEDQDCP